MKIGINCKKHPTYQFKRAPKCAICHRLWILKTSWGPFIGVYNELQTNRGRVDSSKE